MARARLEDLKLNYSGMGDLLKSDSVRAELTARMQRCLDAAQANAPVLTGAYRDGLHIEQATTDRAVVRVIGSSDHDWYVEAETGNLRRAFSQAAQ